MTLAAVAPEHEAVLVSVPTFDHGGKKNYKGHSKSFSHLPLQMPDQLLLLPSSPFLTKIEMFLNVPRI